MITVISLYNCSIYLAREHKIPEDSAVLSLWERIYFFNPDSLMLFQSWLRINVGKCNQQSWEQRGKTTSASWKSPCGDHHHQSKAVEGES